MKIVVQRVSKASVSVNHRLVSQINHGFLLFVGVQKEDTLQDVLWCVNKVSGLRIFEDDQGKMNLNLSQVDGEILSVSQFTLAASVVKGNRPSFTDSEEPDRANELYELFNEELRKRGHSVVTGVFQEMMEVSLINDGPVTILIESRKRNGN